MPKEKKRKKAESKASKTRSKAATVSATVVEALPVKTLLPTKIEFLKISRKPVVDKTKGILDLPERVRVKIFQYLGYEDRACVQLVCRKFRNEIRTRVGLRSRLTDASKQGLVFTRDVIVRSVIVGRFLKPSLSPAQMIGHPDTVSELFFEEPIAFSFLDAFLARCLRTEKIVVAASPFDSVQPSLGRQSSAVNLDYLRNWEDISKNPIHLERLQELSIIIPGRKSLAMVQKLLTVIQGPNLRKLSLRIGDFQDKVDTRAIHTRVLVLLQKMTKLTHLLIATEPSRGIPIVPSGNFLGLGVQKHPILNLGSKIQCKVIILTEQGVSYPIWNNFLSMQKELETFQVMHVLPTKVVRQIIASNYSTLRKIGVHVRAWRKDGQFVPMNMQLLSDCVVLEELMVDFSNDRDALGLDESDDPGIPNVILLRELPQSLRVLALRSCAFITLDLLQMRKDHKMLQSMGFISVKNIGRYPGFGVSHRALLHLLRYPALNELLVTGIRVNERDKAALKQTKKLVGSTLKNNDTAFYVPHKNPNECRWVVDKDKFLYRFVSKV